MKTNFTKIAAVISGALMISACSMGPEFVKPQVNLQSWDKKQTDTVRSQIVPAPMDSEWWKIFQDDTLTSLEMRVARSNLDVKTATNRLLQNRDLLSVTSGAELPSLGATGRYQRQQTTQDGRFDPSGQGGKSPFNLWQAGFDASWELDFWGRTDREVEAAGASVEAAEYSRRNVLVSVLGETARDYIQLRGVQQLKSITRENLMVARNTLKLTRTRFTYGIASNLEVSEALAHVAAIEARLPILDIQESRLINALSYMVDEPPHALQSELEISGGIPQAPTSIPVGLPSQLVQRRPDIRRAEAELHAATARIGAAEADFYPSISLSGNFGFEALQLAGFGNWDKHYFSVGPSLYLPIFEGGRLRGMLNLRETQQQEAAIHFQQVVLKAWHEVDNAMTGYRGYQQENDKLNESLHQTEIALASANKQFVAGAVDFLNVLSVQKSLLSTQEATVQSQTMADLALVGLYKALGGGWEKFTPQIASKYAD